MTDASTQAGDLTSRVEALIRDRDYWRAQHDAVMADWKADADDWARMRADLQAGAGAADRKALLDLMQFFDPASGAITTRVSDQTLSEAFLRLSRLLRS